MTNSLRHSGSAVSGGQVKVTVMAGDCGVRVEVTDRCGDSMPVLPRPAGADAEGHRGMRLVETLAAEWGYRRSGGLATTWFDLRRD